MVAIEELTVIIGIVLGLAEDLEGTDEVEGVDARVQCD
jgi:hypothetical protein